MATEEPTGKRSLEEAEAEEPGSVKRPRTVPDVVTESQSNVNGHVDETKQAEHSISQPDFSDQSQGFPPNLVTTPASSLPITLGKTSGKCKWFDSKKGYGFVKRDLGQEDVFVHQSCIVNKPGYKGLQDDEAVEFDLTKEESGRLRANRVTAPGGGPVTGFPDQNVGASNLSAALGILAGVNVAGSALGAALSVGTAISSGAAARTSQPPTTGTLPEGRYRGVCKWFNPSKGFGFLTPTDGTEDVFVHNSNIISKHTPRTLMEGEHVEFSLMPPDTANPAAKRKANNVTGPGGAHVIGQGQRSTTATLPSSTIGAVVAAPSTATPAGSSAPSSDPFTTYYNQLQQYVQQYPQYAQYAQQQYQQFVTSYYAAANASGVVGAPTPTTNQTVTTGTNSYSAGYPSTQQAYPYPTTTYPGSYSGTYPAGTDPSTQEYPGQ